MMLVITLRTGVKYLNSLESVRILKFYRKEPENQLRMRDMKQSKSPASREIDIVTQHI